LRAKAGCVIRAGSRRSADAVEAFEPDEGRCGSRKLVESERAWDRSAVRVASLSNWLPWKGHNRAGRLRGYEADLTGAVRSPCR